MGAVNTTYTFTATDTITSTKMNNIIDETVMTSDAVLSSGGLEVASGKLTISANAINSSRLAANSVSSSNIVDGTIVNADINASAAIAGTKISPDFGTQVVVAGALNANGSASSYTVAQLTNTSGVQVQLNANGNTEGNVRTTTNHPLTLSTNNTERMRITAAGNVGIGTNNPINYANYTTQTIYGTNGGIVTLGSSNANRAELSYTPDRLELKSVDSKPLFLGTSNLDRITILSGGDVGIGTSTPSVRLAVTGPSEAYNGSGTEGIFQITTGTGANTDNKLQFGVVNGDYSWIQSVDPGATVRDLILNGAGGNVGIGTNSPSTSLQVNGTVTATAFAGPLTGNVTGSASNVNDGVITAPKLSGAQTGTAPVYGIRAFASFNGTAASPISSIVEGNIGTITRTAAGVYSVTFTTSMPSANYTIMANARYLDGNTYEANCFFTSVTASSFVLNVAGGGGNYNSDRIDLMILA